MRFVELNLERYGRFEDCRLAFGDQTPDLHLIYGPNEAGKTTSLAAVSDLLFGFGARSPYAFRFPYPLLRVGAVLEDDGRRFACRRRKTQSASLVDDADQPVDEGILLAMLRGQTRDTFRLSFSLDHARLREGGRAIVDNKDDLGRLLFTAGSGMIHAADALAGLEADADAIWGRRASARRAYTSAERRLDESSRELRERQLKPKTWTDARAELEERQRELSALEAQRQILSAERRAAERLRRIGPAARRRNELLAELGARASMTAMAPQSELLAETAIAAAAEAERLRSAAETLLAEAQAGIAGVDADLAVLNQAEQIDSLVERRGAIRKAARDLPGLLRDLENRRARLVELRSELGAAAADPPPRLVVARLRELAQRHTEIASQASALKEALDDAERRAAPLRVPTADADMTETLAGLVAAVDVARRLGADLDDRCAGHARRAERADAEAKAALARVESWDGALEQLARTPQIGEAEIDTMRGNLNRLQEAAEEEAGELRRLGDELAMVELDRQALASGQAVPFEAVQHARSARDVLWADLRAHLLANDLPPQPANAAATFEQTVTEADAVADRRFALAETSGRLTAMDNRIAALRLQHGQADARREQALADRADLARAWSARLTRAGLPDLEPIRLRAWLEQRAAALAAASAAADANETAAADLLRRDEVRAELLAFIAPRGAEFAGAALAPVLERCERLRAEGEARERQIMADLAELRRLEEAIVVQRGRTEAIDRARADNLAAWQAETSGAGIVIDVEGSSLRLSLFEELRALLDTVSDLDRRIRRMEEDAAQFDADVTALVVLLAAESGEDSGSALDSLRARLAAAAATDKTLKELSATAARRRDEMQTAVAARDAAMKSLAVAFAETGTKDAASLAVAIDASRGLRRLREELATCELQMRDAGDGHAVADLAEAWAGQDPDQLATQATTLDQQLIALNAQITEVSDAVGVARRDFARLDTGPAAADTAADVEQARAEMEAQAEVYLLRRTEVVMLRWAIERFREQRQNPLLLRASELFRTLTLGRYLDLKVDAEAAAPRLLGLCDDGKTLIEVDAMSEGTSDQLFLALRLAAVEQSIASGVRLPFLADDLFINFDDDRARAGFRVLAELARSTQVLFFTHHAHLGPIAREVVGAEALSECGLAQ